MKTKIIPAALLMVAAACTNTSEPVLVAPAVAKSNASAECQALYAQAEQLNQQVAQVQAKSQQSAMRDGIADAALGAGMAAVLGRVAVGGVEAIRTVGALGQGVMTAQAAARAPGQMAEASSQIALAGEVSRVQQQLATNGCR